MNRRNWPLIGYLILAAAVTIALTVQATRIRQLEHRIHIERCAIVRLEPTLGDLLGNPTCP